MKMEKYNYAINKSLFGIDNKPIFHNNQFKEKGVDDLVKAINKIVFSADLKFIYYKNSGIDFKYRENNRLILANIPTHAFMFTILPQFLTKLYIELYTNREALEFLDPAFILGLYIEHGPDHMLRQLTSYIEYTFSEFEEVNQEILEEFKEVNFKV